MGGMELFTFPLSKAVVLKPVLKYPQQAMLWELLLDKRAVQITKPLTPI